LKDLSLILCGKDPDGIQLERLMALSVKLDIEQQVEFKGHVSHEILSKLYANCLTFVYPSSVETFGLPLLEAMAFGAPVICSDKMSVPEVAGDAALVLDPSNTEKFVESLLSVIDNSELAESLSQKGYDRVQQFSWKNCAGQIQEIVENVLVTHKA
jgi:glycosyltransferase involved in cell wall biosynthesis